MSTQDNLQAAFAGESQANQRYLAFAAKAEAEGHPQIAKLFRATAAAETVHAHAHLRVMGNVEDTKKNLQVAIDGERYEFQEMYSDFIQKAEAEGNRAAVNSFRNAMEVEKIHHDLYTNVLKTLMTGKDLPIVVSVGFSQSITSCFSPTSFPLSSSPIRRYPDNWKPTNPTELNR
jgi:rubrerythrin